MVLSIKNKKIKIIVIIILSVISNIGMSQTYIDKIIKSTEYINKNKFLNIFVGKTCYNFSNHYLPIFVKSNNKIEKIIIRSNDICAFYEKKWGENFYMDIKLGEEYQQFVKNLILCRDTLEIDSSFFSNEGNKEVTIYKIPLDHYIYHFPDSAKKEIIKTYFDENGLFIDDSIHAFAPLINKLSEWFIFIEQMAFYDDYHYILFDFRRYYEENNFDEIIHKSLKLFIEQNRINETVNIIELTFPINIFIDFSEIGCTGKKIGLIQAKDPNIKNVKAISLDGIYINDNIISIELLYSNYDYSKEKDNVIQYRLKETKFSYKYLEEQQIWQLIDESQVNY